MIKYNIIDNFLDQSVFDKMANKIMPIGHTRKTKETVVGLPWIYNHSQTLAEKEEPEYPRCIEGVTDIELLDLGKQSFFYFLFYKGTITNYDNIWEDQYSPIEVGEILTDVQLLNTDSIEILISNTDGKFRFISFIFTRCPMPNMCPALLFKQQYLAETLANRNIEIIIFIDP